MIKDKKINQINEYLSKWDGGDADFNHYKVGMGDIFGIALHKDGLGSVGLRFSVPLFIQGPTFWSNTSLRCKAVIHDDNDCFEITDDAAGFKVIAGSSIMAGNNELFITVAE